MFTKLRVGLAFCAFGAGLVAPLIVGATEPSGSFPVAAVIAQVKRELAAAQNSPGASVGLKLDKVELNFALTRTVDANGKVTIGVPAVGVEIGGNGSRKTEDASSLLVELVPPRPLGIMSGADTRDFGLTEAIVETRRQLRQGLDDDPKLEPRKVQITLRFVVTRTGGPTGQIKFLVFSVGGGANISATDASSIVLTFSKSAAP